MTDWLLIVDFFVEDLERTYPELKLKTWMSLEICAHESAWSIIIWRESLVSRLRIQLGEGQGCDETRDLVSGIPLRTREVHIADILVLTQEMVYSLQDVRVLTIQDKVLECLLNSQGKRKDLVWDTKDGWGQSLSSTGFWYLVYHWRSGEFTLLTP